MNRFFFIAGPLLVLIGLIGFLAAAVALADADDVPEIKTPPGVEITRSPDDPEVHKRRGQAERVVFGSMLTGGVGVALLGVGWWRRRRQRLSR